MKVKRLSLLALFIALSAVGAEIKFPGMLKSVALDSFPAIVAGGLLGGAPGAVVGALGHLLSALFGGFPLGPMHLMIAAEMAVLVWLFAIFYRNNKKYMAGIFFIIGNAFVAPIPFIFIYGKMITFAMIPSLFISSAINTILAIVILPRLSSAVIRKKHEFHQ